jgi:hypothetical protein
MRRLADPIATLLASALGLCLGLALVAAYFNMVLLEIVPVIGCPGGDYTQSVGFASTRAVCPSGAVVAEVDIGQLVSGAHLDAALGAVAATFILWALVRKVPGTTSRDREVGKGRGPAARGDRLGGGRAARAGPR